MQWIKVHDIFNLEIIWLTLWLTEQSCVTLQLLECSQIITEYSFTLQVFLCCLLSYNWIYIASFRITVVPSIMNLNLNILIIIKAGVWKWLNEMRGKWSSGKALTNDNTHQSLFICRAVKLIEMCLSAMSKCKNLPFFNKGKMCDKTAS